MTLDKNHAIETVVNKLDTIDNEFRFFQMEVLAGRPDFMVDTHECGCRFRFDFSKVYWNSRLQAEHARLVASFDKEDVVCDGFAGVGPFAIPAAKKGCLGVLSNDLNPASAQSCEENAILNKTQDRIRNYNDDGRRFFRQAVRDVYYDPFKPRTELHLSANKAGKKARRERQQNMVEPLARADCSVEPLRSGEQNRASSPTPSPALGKFIDHFILNLPASAIDFLDSFQGIYASVWQRPGSSKENFMEDLAAYSQARGKADDVRLPMVHCYCFTKSLDEYEKDICQVRLCCLRGQYN